MSNKIYTKEFKEMVVELSFNQNNPINHTAK